MDYFLQIHFSEFNQSERFQSLFHSRKVDEHEIDLQLLEPLKIKFNTIAATAPRRLQYLYRLQAHYELLSDVKTLSETMKRWKSCDSAAATQKSIKEYKVI